MEKIKVGLDLDGVVYDFATAFEKYCANKDIFLDNNFYDYGLSRDKVKGLLTDFGESEPFLWIKAYEGVIEKVKEFEKYFDYHIITHRGWLESGKRNTIYRLYKDKINYKELRFSKEKGHYANAFGLDLFFEDSLDNAKDIINKSKTDVILIDRTYNQGYDNPRLKRIKSITDFVL